MLYCIYVCICSLLISFFRFLFYFNFGVGCWLYRLFSLKKFTLSVYSAYICMLHGSLLQDIGFLILSNVVKKIIFVFAF